MPDAGTTLEALSDWAERTHQGLMAQEAAERSRDLHLFGQPLIQGYRSIKTGHGLLDFNDLVDRARALLKRRLSA